QLSAADLYGGRRALRAGAGRAPGPRRAEALGRSLRLAEILAHDRADDDEEGGEAQQVEPAALFQRQAYQRGHRVGERQQQEGDREHEEERISRPAPEAQEENRADREAHGDHAGEEFGRRHYSTSQMKP